MGAQRELFDSPRGIAPAPPRPEHHALAAALPARLRLATMSWTFPGWAGIVYGARLTPKALAAQGLAAYARHPLLRAVEIDRSYYEPLPAELLRAYAAAVPDDFRFLAKAHEACTVLRFPPHARYGKQRGRPNPRFLDPGYAAEQVVGPFVAGLGAKGGVLLFQFPPQDAGDPATFVRRLRDFLRHLPAGPRYAVEIRNAELLTPAYGAALAEAGAVHCHNVWTAMPPVLQQARRMPAEARRPLVVRWLLRPGDVYDDARTRYAPFDRLAGEDLAVRAEIADLAGRALRHDVDVLIAINNKAEGCAPESIFQLAHSVAQRCAATP